MEIRYGDIRNSTVSDNATVSVTPRFIRDCPFITGHDLTGMSTSPFAVRSTVVESPRYFYNAYGDDVFDRKFMPFWLFGTLVLRG